MDDVEQLVQCVTSAAKISRITHIVHEAYQKSKPPRRNKEERKEVQILEKEKPLKKIKKEKLVRHARTINISEEEQEDCKTWIKQFEEKDGKHFFKATRMSIANFNYLLSRLENKLKRFSQRRPIDPEKRLAVTLIYFAQGCKMKVLAWGFKLGITTIHKIIYATSDAIWEELHDAFLTPPNSVELQTISDEFYKKTELPNCLGALDGKQIILAAPRKGEPAYSNYKKSRSIILLAACDANYVFTYADVIELTGQEDGDAINRSEFGNNLLNGTLETIPDKELPGTTKKFPHYFVGNGTYPLKTNLLRPFPGRYVTTDKEHFNILFSKVLSHIENAFGILASRWRILKTKIQTCAKNADRIILATVALHNFLMLQSEMSYFTPNLVDHNKNGEDIPGRWRLDISPLKSYKPRYSNHPTAKASKTRDTLNDFLQAKGKI